MAKAKITLMFELEYEIIPSMYQQDDDTDEKRLERDLNQAKEEFKGSLGDGCVLVDVVGEVVNDEESAG